VHRIGVYTAVALDIRNYIDTTTVTTVLFTALKLKNAHIRGIERIGGLTNKNFKVYLDNATYVVRIPGPGTGRFINRSHEKANNLMMSRLKLSPEILYFNKRNGIKISEFISRATTYNAEYMRQRENYVKVARLLKAVHTSPVEFTNEFDVFRLIDTYENIVHRLKGRFYPDYAAVRREVFSFKEELLCLDTVPCHNDLVPENIIEYGEKICLLDWEYSGMNDPLWDIAGVFAESDFLHEQQEDFLVEYFAGSVPYDAMHKIELYRIVMDFLWSIWAIIQMKSNKGEEALAYWNYGLRRYIRAKETISSLIPV